ncbi:tail fiber protein [Luteolibacter flavescens]|uniref:Tail fiber protein n=1 Tax=Luteolibacter flavescens TaxID=1859460 RepID=A0ABT3FST2_9BACT|nr:tail fiber protein [Luteolibacter flavescens]MCW1886296.1 tail fiber protein [Luteolibacter flavescens]
MSNPYIGEIRMVGFNFAPPGWALCHGQLLAISEYEVLFQLIGTTYGGDGQQTFAVPDLRGRAPVHMGQGPTLSPRTLGQFSGSETETIVTQQLPAHSHPLSSVGVPSTNLVGNAASPGSLRLARASDGEKNYSSDVADGAIALAFTGNTQPVGNTMPHANLPPFLTVNFIISLFGIFPSPT